MTKLLELRKPAMVAEAAMTKSGMHIALEILVFIAVFLVSSIAEVIVIVPVQLIMMFTDSDYMNAALSGDMAGVAEAANTLVQSDVMTVVMLFSNLGIILVTLLFCRLIQKRKVATVGFQKPGMWKEYAAGLGIGFGIFTAAVLICVATGALRLRGLSPSFSAGMFVLFFLGYMVQGMAEEVLCRGYFLVSVSRRYPLAAGIAANAVLFAALHLLNDGITPLAFVNLVLFGVFASVYFVKRGNIWGVGALHSIWNLAQGNVYGIRVSGIQTSCSVLSSEMVEGRELINGGAFGLEGGLAVTFVLAAGMVVLLATKQRRYAEG